MRQILYLIHLKAHRQVLSLEDNTANIIPKDDKNSQIEVEFFMLQKDKKWGVQP